MARRVKNPCTLKYERTARGQDIIHINTNDYISFKGGMWANLSYIDEHGVRHGSIFKSDFSKVPHTVSRVVGKKHMNIIRIVCKPHISDGIIPPERFEFIGEKLKEYEGV